MKCPFLLSFFLFLLVIFAHAQIIEVNELVNSSTQKIALGKYNIVDINSKLEISLNTAVLSEKISRNNKANTQLLAQLDELNFILANQIEIMKILNDSCKQASQHKSIKILGTYSVLMNEFYNRIVKNESLRNEADDLFTDYFEKRSTLDKTLYPSPQAYVIKNLSLNAQAIINQLKQSDELNKVNIQLVAFLNTKANPNQKVHIENFDTYAAGEFYTVNRWVTSFSDNEIKAFNSAGKLAGELNDVVTNSVQGLNKVLSDNLSSYRSIENILEQLKKISAESDSLFKNNEAAANLFIENIETELDSFIKLFDKLIQPTAANVNVLNQYNGIRNDFINKVKIFPSEIDSLFNLFMIQLTQANEPLIALKDSIDKCVIYIKHDAEMINGMGNYVANIFTPFKNSADSANAIGTEVINYSIGQLPDFGIVDLKTTGIRENGDELEVKVVISNSANESMPSKAETIECQTLVLQQVNLYSESKVSLILASPLSKNTKVQLENRFQFAPSGSLLFKFGSRKSRTWNYLEPGLGINMSTPDFNLDGTPDVAFGAVFSIVKGLAMVGWSYNIQTDSPFWFFGLSLPFSIPGAPVNNILTNQ